MRRGREEEEEEDLTLVSRGKEDEDAGGAIGDGMCVVDSVVDSLAVVRCPLPPPPPP